MRIKRARLWCPFCNRQAWASSWVFWALCGAGATLMASAFGAARMMLP